MKIDEQLISDSQISAFILGNFSTREFVLVDTALWPVPDCLPGRGFVFVGTTGIVNGAPRTAFAVELDDAAMSAIAMAWVQYLAARIIPHLEPPARIQFNFLSAFTRLRTRATDNQPCACGRCMIPTAQEFSCPGKKAGIIADSSPNSGPETAR